MFSVIYLCDICNWYSFVCAVHLWSLSFDSGMRFEVSDVILRKQLSTWLEFSGIGPSKMPATLMIYAGLLISPEPLTADAKHAADDMVEEACQNKNML